MEAALLLQEPPSEGDRVGILSSGHRGGTRQGLCVSEENLVSPSKHPFLSFSIPSPLSSHFSFIWSCLLYH